MFESKKIRNFFIGIIIINLALFSTLNIFDINKISRSLGWTITIIGIIMVLISLVYFIFLRFHSLKLFKEESKNWWKIFYIDYLLLIFTFLLTEVFDVLAILVVPIIGSIILISDIVLLIQSFSTRPKLAYFINLLIILLIITIPVVIFAFIAMSEFL